MTSIAILLAFLWVAVTLILTIALCRASRVPKHREPKRSKAKLL